MRRSSHLFFAFLLIFALAPVTMLTAQVESEEGTMLKVTGDLEVRSFYRSENINKILNNTRSPENFPGPATSPNSQSDSYMHYNVGLEAELDKQVSARLELENRILDDDFGAGTEANNGGIIGNDIGGNTFETHIGQAYIDVGNFLSDRVSVRLGIQNYDTDFRGTGNAFLLDVRNSEAIWNDTPSDRAHILEHTARGATVTSAGPPGSARFGGRNLNHEAGGLVATYEMSDAVSTDFFYFSVDDTSDAGGVAGTDNSRDESLYGVTFNGDLNNGSWMAVANVFSNDSGGARVWNIGGGVSYWLADNLETFGEFYYQDGEYRDDTANAVEPSGAGDAAAAPSVDQSSFAGYAGTRFEMDGAAEPWVEGKFMVVSGDDGNQADGNKDFISYEDNDETIVMEDNVLGLDVDANYWKGQVSGGGTFELLGKDLDVEVLAAYFHTYNEMDFGGSEAGVTRSLDSELGIETDVKLTWTYSDNLSFDAGLGYVWNGEFWSDAQGFNVDQSFGIATVGANLTF